MKLGSMFAAIAIAAVTAAPVHAQVAGLGTTQAGATNQLSVAVAKVISDKGGLQVRTQPMAGVAQYAPLVNAGEVELGVANIVEVAYLVQGKVIVDNRPHPDLRIVARLVPWYNGLVVKADSPIKSLRDLKGQPVPAGFTGNPLGKVLIEGYLANAGLTPADTKQILVPAFPRMFDMFKQQQIVTSIMTIGSSVLKEADVALNGVRYLPFDDSAAAVAALQKFIPQSYVVEVKPEPGLTGIPAPTKVLVYDYVIFASTKTRDDVVTKAIDALYSNPADLKATGALWKEFEPAQMGRDVGVAYHPAAIRYLQSKGAWKR